MERAISAFAASLRPSNIDILLAVFRHEVSVPVRALASPQMHFAALCAGDRRLWIRAGCPRARIAGRPASSKLSLFPLRSRT